MLTIMGGNIHFAQAGQRVGIMYVNTLDYKTKFEATITVPPLVTYVMTSIVSDEMGSIPMVIGMNYQENSTQVLYSFETTDWDNPKPWTGLGVVATSYQEQKQTWIGNISLDIPLGMKNGSIIYIPYYTQGFGSSVSAIQIRITALSNSNFTPDPGVSWFTLNRNDTIPTTNTGQTGWDLNWDEDSGTWGTIEKITGGGRYKETLVVIGQTSIGNGCVYFSI